MNILLFPGQGAQRIGMAKDLADSFPEAASILAEIDDALDSPLTPIMWQGPDAELVETQNTQPAVLAHSAAVLSIIRQRLKGNVIAAAGHSLGEYSAWHAAGALSAADAARLVRQRGTLMHLAGQSRPGTMAAVLGLSAATVQAACTEASAGNQGVVVAANLNAPEQTVISGDPIAVEIAGAACKAAGARRVLALNVGGAFHSPLMEPAVAGLSDALQNTDFGEPAFSVVANVTASLINDSKTGKQLLADQLTAPVRWVESMTELASRWPEANWLEIGPGSVLTGLLKKIVPELSCTTLGTAAEIQEWLDS